MDEQHSQAEHHALATHRDPSVDRRRKETARPKTEYGIEWVSVSELGQRASTRVLAHGARVNRLAIGRARTAVADRARRLAPLAAFGRTAHGPGQGHTRSL